ncbi:hypothetical protein [Ochrobactrum sp. Marseille-Q0166]|uniref:hypothetical protein n=1 Tax=Ochrobactrum sp. Marseille-Q0166 TaxID=2761105 RepID=UPI001655DF38|nr:hypothetical protein [Ochrobactrum sp. Marseille-Q0166]MBC8718179.1 hypothetical protein [Ochrobactrum sp. Marseille-Q0166]
MRVRMGIKPGVGPILKVMKNDNDNPFTTAIGDYDKFYFDSESQRLSYDYAHKSYGELNKSRFPTGSYSLDGKPLSQTLWGLRSNYGPTQSYDYFYPIAFLGRMTDLPFPPITDARVIGSDGWVRAYAGYFPNSNGGPRAWGVMNSCILANVEAGRTGLPEYRNIAAEFQYNGWAGRADTTGGTYSAIVSTPGDNITFAVWDLPSGPETEPAPPARVSGQKAISMSKARIAVAKPGYDVRTAIRRNMIMDSDKSPVKCVLFGETPMISPGQTYFFPKETSFDLDPTMHMELFLKPEGSNIFQLPPVSYTTPGNDSRRVDFFYRVDADGVRFRATGAYGHAAKFVLFANGPAAFTTGGSKIIRRLPNGIQFKRPGSSDTAPNYNDILLDTRLPTAYVVQDEWVAISRFTSGNGGVYFDIPLPNKNMFFYPKVMADFGDVRRHANYYVNVRLYYQSGWGNIAIYETSRQTFVIQNHETFYRAILYPDAPGDTNLPGPTGIRYHLLGITKP